MSALMIALPFVWVAEGIALALLFDRATRRR